MENIYKYTCIFGGGAIRGMSYIGAVKALEDLGIYSETIAGSSVGAIIAGMYALGYNSQEMQEVFLKVNFDLFRDIHFGFGKTFALSKGEVFLDWLREIIEKKYYGENYQKSKNPSVKFKDLDKELIIITTDLTNFTCKEFSKKSTPDFEVATAIRISSSMPGLMTSVEYEGMELVDGDLQKSWPLWKLSKNLSDVSERILEFRLEGSYDKNSKSPIDYLNTVYSCVTSIATKSVVNMYDECDKYDYVTINTGDVIIVDFNMPIEKRNELIDIGYNQTIQKFKNFLPSKKEKLIKHYKVMEKGVSDVVKALEKKDVVTAKSCLGQIYMDICDCKNYIDERFYKNLQNAKFRFLNELKPTLFRYYPSGKVNAIKEDFIQLDALLKERIKELRDYNLKIGA